MFGFNLRNPLSRNVVPDHFEAEKKRYAAYVAWTLSFAFCLVLTMLVLTPLVASLFGYGMPALVKLPFHLKVYWFVHDLLDSKMVRLHAAFIHHSGIGGGSAWIWYLGVGSISMLIGVLPQLFNPYENSSKKQGDVKWADDRTFIEMREKAQFTVDGDGIGVLGEVMSGKFKGNLFQMKETLSLLCIAPPGTGKTASVVVPNLMLMDNVSVIINDPKPEIWAMTGEYRSRTSIAIMLDWGRVDRPEEGIFYARFNPLSPKIVPPSGPSRDTYVDAMAKSMVPDKSEGDSYFQDRGRAALTAFIHYLIAKVGDARDYSGIPTQWVGKEPSVPMMIDWIAAAQFQAKKDQQADDFGGGGGGDPLSSWFDNLAESCDPERYRSWVEQGRQAPQKVFFAPSSFREFSNLSSTADKERSGILGTLDQSLIPFKNQAVAERTSACDFTPDDLRGMVDPRDGKVKPVSLYICSNQAEAPAFSKITALFFEVLSLSLLTYGPGEYNERTGRVLGEFPVCFLLDEFAKLPKMEQVIAGPDLGRSKKTMYWFLFQSYSQLDLVYKEAYKDILMSTCAVKIVLSQNDFKTIEMVQKTVGQTTILENKLSYTEGLQKGASPFATSRSIETSGQNFFRSEDISAMPAGTHIVLVQGFLNRPVRLKTLMFFKVPSMIPNVFSRGKGKPPGSVLPEMMLTRRRLELKVERRRNQIRAAEAIRKDMASHYRPPKTIRMAP